MVDARHPCPGSLTDLQRHPHENSSFHNICSPAWFRTNKEIEDI